jgi:hypothetical protein
MDGYATAHIGCDSRGVAIRFYGALKNVDKYLRRAHASRDCKTIAFDIRLESWRFRLELLDCCKICDACARSLIAICDHGWLAQPKLMSAAGQPAFAAERFGGAASAYIHERRLASPTGFEPVFQP